MKIIVVAALAMLVGSELASAEPRALANFTRVSTQSGIPVEISVGPNFSVDVTGRDADRIMTTVSGGQLNVRPQSQFGWGRRDALVRVVMPQVEGLEASSGARIRAQGLAGGDVTLDASSGAQISVSGACASISAEASSGANANVSALACQTGSVDVSSGGSASVNVDGRLDVEASSGGHVYVSGTPEMGDISLSSGGSLHRR